MMCLPRMLDGEFCASPDLLSSQVSSISNRGSGLTIPTCWFSILPTSPTRIGALVGAYVTHQKEGRGLLLVGVNPRVRIALQVTHVDQFFQYSDTVPAE